MFAPMFDGQFRSKPSVSLRGASKQGVMSNNLLSKARHLREERERERRRNTSSVTIQACYRGHVTRKKVCNEIRRHFDNGCGHCSGPAHLFTLSSQLLLFYQETRDHERLVLLCQKWVQLKVPILKELATPKSPSPFLLRRLLVVCLRSLHINPAQALASPLRMIEVYTNKDECHCSNSMLGFLMNRGYYATLRKLIETRLPPPDEDTPLQPLGASLVEYLLRPIKLKIADTYCFIMNELLAPPLSTHLCHLILPALKDSNLTLPSLLELAAVKLNSHALQPSATLCYCILRLLQAHMESLSESSVGHLLLLISKVMESWTSERLMQASQEDEEEDDEREELGTNRDLEDMELDPTSGTFALYSCLLEQVTNGPVVDAVMKYQDPSAPLLGSLCSTCYHLLAISSLSPVRHRLIRSLALSSPLLRRIWLSISTMTMKRTFGSSVNAFDHFRRGSSVPPKEGHALLHQLSSFSILLSISLSSLHDVELASMGPFSLQELGKMALKLRDVYVTLNMTMLHPSPSHFSPFVPVSSSSSQSDTSQGPKIYEWQLLSNVLYRLLKSLYDRNSRLEFCPVSSCWASLPLDNVHPDLFLETEEDEDLPHPSYPAVVFKQANLLKKTPFVFSFKDRVAFFHKLVAHTRYSRQGRFQDFLIGPSVSITARRSHLYEDAFSKLATQDMKQRLRVLLVNEQGLEEAGIDGGGLFREFLSETLKTGFDPNRGFFTTTKEGFLYPNPTVHLVNEDHSLHYRFLGTLLGKVLLEQMMVELPFAPFFLCKLTSSGRGWIDTHHLGSLDPELYHHLLWLKNHQGDFEELGLDFTTLSNEFGQSKVVELKPGGGNVQVTWGNRIEYIHLLANYHLNRRIDSQFQSFREGLNTVIPIQWLTLFNQSELQTLISGAEEPINMADLREHTSYSGSYKEDHDCICMFWDIVSEFTELEKRQLLKFVTSCSRPPLFGFKNLHPSFSILSAKETDHLPSASTCMHLLKLPMFETKQEMKEKLVYAISSGAGFELS